MLGYSLRNAPTLLESIDMLNLNRPKRKSFDQWIADLQALSGQRDVSQEDAQVQEAFAQDPKYASVDPTRPMLVTADGSGLSVRNVTADELYNDDYLTKFAIELERERARYAAAECADGRHREDHPNDPTND